MPLSGGQPLESGSSAINDGINTAQKASVQQFHNADNQTLSVTANGLLTGGVAQLISAIGNLNRQREAYADNIPSTGVPTGSQQLASPFTVTTTSTITAGSTATVTLSATSGTNRGAAWSVVVGTAFVVAPGTANAEPAVVTSISGTSATLAFAGTNNGAKYAHSGTTSLAGFAYNQARDATTPDGSTGQGFAAGATFLYNSSLNAGAGGWESERSANGELDGATGAGTAVAAEYEYNGAGPGGGNYDRARNVQGKGIASGAITTATQGTSSLVLSAAPTNLQAGQQIFLAQSATNLLTGAATEVVYVSPSYAGGATVTLTSNILNAGHTVAAWSTFSATGPGSNVLLPDGIGMEADVVYDPTTGLYAEEYAFTQDAMALKNIETVGKMSFNGTAADRDRSGPAGTAIAGGTSGVPYVQGIGQNGAVPITIQNVTGSFSLTSAATPLVLPVLGYEALSFTITGTWAGTLVMYASDDGGATYPWVMSGLTPGGPASSTTTNTSFKVLVAPHSTIKIYFSVYTSGTAVITYNLGSSPSFNLVDPNGNTPYASNPNDSLGASTGLFSVAFGHAYNGTMWDRSRKDTYAAGPQWHTDGGSTTAMLSAATIASTGYVVKASAGRICRAIVTALGTAATLFYDSTSLTATTGTAIGAIPASTPVGTVLTFEYPASAGIACPVQANASSCSVSFF